MSLPTLVVFILFILFIYLFIFDYGSANGQEVVPYCNFDLYFSNNEWGWARFSHARWYFTVLK